MYWQMHYIKAETFSFPGVWFPNPNILVIYKIDNIFNYKKYSKMQFYLFIKNLAISPKTIQILFLAKS